MLSKKVSFILFLVTFSYFSYLQFFVQPQQQEEKKKPKIYNNYYNQQSSGKQCLPDQPHKTAVFDYSYIRKEHKEHLVRDYFDDKCDWRVKSYGSVSHYHLIWVFNPNDINYSKHYEGQHMVNHIENLYAVVDKAEMLNTLTQFDKKQQYSINSQDFLPETYIINFKSQKYTDEEKKFINSNPKGIWILKPTRLFGGMGIQMISDPSKFVQIIKKSKSQANGQKVVVQKYIENPLLIEKKKFDIRCYIMIPCNAPYFVLFHHGFIRRTLQEYSLNQNQIQDMYVHLTNIEAQKKHKDYEKFKNETQMSMPEFENYLKSNLNIEQHQIDKIYQDMKSISTYLIQASKDQLVSRQGYFQILGLDFMLDDNLKVFLIEANKSPSWQILHPHQQFKKKMLFTFIDMVLKVNEQFDNIDYLLQNYQSEFDLSSGYELLINDALNYTYIDKLKQNQQNINEIPQPQNNQKEEI